MTFIISVELRCDKADCFNLFQSKVIKSNRIQQCYYITGETDFILIVTAKGMDDLDDFTKRLFWRIATFYILKRQSSWIEQRSA